MGFAVLLQFIAGVICVAVAAFFGWAATWSAVIAALIAILPNAIFATYLAIAPKPAEYRFFVGEGILIAVALIAASLVWWRYGLQVQPLVYWVVLIIVLKAHNFGLLGTVKE